MPEPVIQRVEAIIGMEIHVELATRSKMFSPAPNPASWDAGSTDAEGEHRPNARIDPIVLGLPGALPVMNAAAVEMAILAGLALRCSIAPLSRWDRKSYFYPDLPKGYQISQYDLPLCFDGVVELPGLDESGREDPEGPTTPIGIIRAHLEEDAGKLLHEAPGGAPIDFTLADFDRAGAPLLEIVTAPDLRSAEQAAHFARSLRTLLCFLGVTRGDMQKGHVRFEPNINCRLSLSDGTLVHTPIVEIKNLNSFRSVKAAIEYELEEQPQRWRLDGRVAGPGTKTTRGWNEDAGRTFVQREKEDAHDYRYFPDPDLPPVAVDEAWIERLRAALPELPRQRMRRYARDFTLGAREAAVLVDERATAELFDRATDAGVLLGLNHPRAGRVIANLLLGAGQRLAKERGQGLHELGLTPAALAALAFMREQGELNNQAGDSLFPALLEAPLPADPVPALEALRTLAGERGLIVVRDEAAMQSWVAAAIAAHPKAAEDVRAGKMQAIGRLVGEAMKQAGGKADAAAVRVAILAALGAAP